MLEQDQVVNLYDHFLYYDDPEVAKAALEHVQEAFDPSAEVVHEASGDIILTTGYAYTVVFTTDGEFEDAEAQALFRVVSPDAYDLNIAEEDDEEEDDEEEGEFPAVFTERERELAVAEAEDAELTIEYIRRLERVAYAAWVLCVKTCDLPVTLSQSSNNIASLPVVEVYEVLCKELRSVDFMR